MKMSRVNHIREDRWIQSIQHDNPNDNWWEKVYTEDWQMDPDYWRVYGKKERAGTLKPPEKKFCHVAANSDGLIHYGSFKFSKPLSKKEEPDMYSKEQFKHTSKW